MVARIFGIILNYVCCPLSLWAAPWQLGRKSNLQRDIRKEAKIEVVNLFFLERSIWWEVPTVFNIRKIGNTLVTRIQAKLYPTTSRIVFLKWALLICRTVQLNFKKLKIITKNVLGKICLRNSQEIYFVVDRMCSVLKKIEDCTGNFCF